jgi:hypothetical protein
MRSTWPSGAAYVCEEHRVGTGNLYVVVLDRNRVEHATNEGGPRRATDIVCEFHADEKLSRGDGRDRDIIFVSDEPIELPASSLRIDKHGRVKDQAGH